MSLFLTRMVEYDNNGPMERGKVKGRNKKKGKVKKAFFLLREYSLLVLFLATSTANNLNKKTYSGRTDGNFDARVSATTRVNRKGI